jgi:hypothetical protein
MMDRDGSLLRNPCLALCVAIWAAIYWYRGRERKTDPIKLRMRQAAKLKWKQTAEITEARQLSFGARLIVSEYIYILTIRADCVLTNAGS